MQISTTQITVLCKFSFMQIRITPTMAITDKLALDFVQKLLLKFESMITKTRMRLGEIRGRMNLTEKAK